MDIRPVFTALTRNRTGALLVALQVAIALAVIANAFFIIEQRLEKLHRPTGIDTPNLIFLQSYGYAAEYDQDATRRDDLALLRSLPGVVDATPVNSVPLSGGGSSMNYQRAAKLELNPAPGNYFEVDGHFLGTFGLELVAGRNFAPQEFLDKLTDANLPPVVIVTESMARQLFGAEPAVGRRVYDSTGGSAEVVGVVRDMLGSWVNSTHPKVTELVFHPNGSAGPQARYAVRTQPGERARLIPLIEQRLEAAGRGRTITWVRPHEFWLERTYQGDTRMVVFLATLAGLRIVGLATFQVNARRKQIGTRRALGARRRDILGYFLVENAMLAAGGSVLGLALAYIGSGWLVRTFQLPALPPGYVLATALGIALLGQLAVLWPARRAAAIEPAIATRTV